MIDRLRWFLPFGRQKGSGREVDRSRLFFWWRWPGGAGFAGTADVLAWRFPRLENLYNFPSVLAKSLALYAAATSAGRVC